MLARSNGCLRYESTLRLTEATSKSINNKIPSPLRLRMYCTFFCRSLSNYRGPKFNFNSDIWHPTNHSCEIGERKKCARSHIHVFSPLRPNSLAVLYRVSVRLAEVPRLEVGLLQGPAVIDVPKSPLALLVPPAAPEAPWRKKSETTAGDKAQILIS